MQNVTWETGRVLVNLVLREQDAKSVLVGSMENSVSITVRLDAHRKNVVLLMVTVIVETVLLDTDATTVSLGDMVTHVHKFVQTVVCQENVSRTTVRAPACRAFPEQNVNNVTKADMVRTVNTIAQQDASQRRAKDLTDLVSVAMVLRDLRASFVRVEGMALIVHIDVQTAVSSETAL